MSNLENAVAGHYASGDLYDRIIGGLRAMGVDPDAATAADLRGADEFHIGGAVATDDLLGRLDLARGARALDIGSGIGGASRHMASVFGLDVVGVDLTPDFVEVARRLSDLVSIPVDFRVGSALDLPVEDGVFDLATLLHVGMNIPDKPRLFAEAFRALKPGGVFAVYDVMADEDAASMAFPVPWASEPTQSALAPPEAYRAAAEAAGFVLEDERDRAAFAREFFDAIAARFKDSGPPPFSVALTMGEKAREKTSNMVANLHAGRYAPREMIFRKP